MPTLLLTRGDCAELLEPEKLLPALRQGFIAHSQGRTLAPQRLAVPLPLEGSRATALLPGSLPDIPAYSVKVNAKFPGQRPAIRGLVLLFDLQTGGVLAVLESGLLTAVRTGAASALATHTLARPDAATAAVVGAGEQGRWQLRCLARLRRLERVFIYDSSPFRAGRFAAELAREIDAKLIPVDSLAEALLEAEIVLAATWSSMPFLYPDMLPDGSHVTSLGADEEGKLEASAELLSASRVIVDDRASAVSRGAVGNAGLDETAIAAELGEVLSAALPGRTDEYERTLYASVGLPWQDLAAAWQVYERALTSGVGTTFNFGV